MGESNKIINKEIHLDGYIDVSKNPISAADITDKFIEWIESNNWYFNGITTVEESEVNNVK